MTRKSFLLQETGSAHTLQRSKKLGYARWNFSDRFLAISCARIPLAHLLPRAASSPRIVLFSSLFHVAAAPVRSRAAVPDCARLSDLGGGRADLGGNLAVAKVQRWGCERRRGRGGGEDCRNRPQALAAEVARIHGGLGGGLQEDDCLEFWLQEFKPLCCAPAADLSTACRSAGACAPPLLQAARSSAHLPNLLLHFSIIVDARVLIRKTKLYWHVARVL